MGAADQKRSLDEAFERIEETILPSISLMLDTLLDAANLAKSGIDADIYAAELRTQRHITIHHDTIPGANHFFQNEMPQLMKSVDDYLDFRLDPACTIR